MKPKIVGHDDATEHRVTDASSPANTGAARQLYHLTFRGRRRRWVAIHYAQSFGSQPTRPLLRLSDGAGRFVEHVLPAAIFGNTEWIGFAHSEFTELEILSYELRPQDFRIYSVVELTLAQLQPRLWRRGARQLWRFWTHDWWPSLVRQYHTVPYIPDRYRLTEFKTFAIKHGRPVELNGLDRITTKRDADCVVEYLLSVSDRVGLTALAATLTSLRAQAMDRWCLSIAAGPTLVAEIVRLTSSSADKNIRVVEFPENELGSAALAQLVARTKHTTIGFLEPGDQLAPEALLAILPVVAGKIRPSLLYTDSATIDARGRLVAPRLLPDWSPEYFRRADYVDGSWLFDATLAKNIVPAISIEPNQFRTRLLEAIVDRLEPKQIHHVKRVILLRPERKTAGTSRQDQRITVSGPQPLVSIIVPTRDRTELLKRAIETVREKTTYPHYEIIIVDNGSTDPSTLAYLAHLQAQKFAKVVVDKGDFNFPRLINSGVDHAIGDVLLLLNNDTYVIEPNWLTEMVGLATRPGTGAVGAKLLYPDGTIQHAGIVLGLGGYAGHIFRRRPQNHMDHLGRLGFVHEVSAVTAACLMITRKGFERVGGFDETFAVDFNDVDFCLRLRRAGLQNLWTPAAILGHAESASRVGPRGRKSARFRAEAKQFAQRWRAETLNDPYFHPALALRIFDEMLE